MLSLNDWATAAAAITPMTTAFLQWVKQFPFIKNSWTVYFAPFVGIAFAILWLIASGQIIWDNGIWLQDGLMFFKSVVEGFFGGMGAPIAYGIQKQLPENARILQPGPDNHPADKHIETSSIETSSQEVPQVVPEVIPVDIFKKL